MLLSAAMVWAADFPLPDHAPELVVADRVAAVELPHAVPFVVVGR